jgi:V8-like Glu-specific endopeptidase
MGKQTKSIGRRSSRLASLVALALAAALALPALAAAEPTEGVVAGTFAPSPIGTGTQWTPAALEEAEPLPVVELPGSPPAGARTAAITAEAATNTAFEGAEVGAGEFPNLANGKLFGEYRIPLNSEEIEIKKYECSASVVPSRKGNVILTAAHCVIDPETGVTATAGSVVFIPGYHNGVAPDGAWEAVGYRATESWGKWAEKKLKPPNEGTDLAFLLLEANQESENSHYRENVEKVAGSLGIAFDQACDQTYTQYGYPAEAPYDGEILYSHTTPYIGTDPSSAITPKPVKVASDFTGGSSGGPWTIGSSSALTALSVTAYGYEGQPGYLYGPYFGETARATYEHAALKSVPIGIEETCKALPENTTPSEPAPPAPAPPAPTPTPIPTPTPVVSLKVTRVHRLANGSAALTAQVSTAGKLKLSGAAVRAESVSTPAAGKYRMVVSAKGPTSRKLRQNGKAKVGVKVAFSASGKTDLVSRSIQLSRRAAR